MIFGVFPPPSNLLLSFGKDGSDHTYIANGNVQSVAAGDPGGFVSKVTVPRSGCLSVVSWSVSPDGWLAINLQIYKNDALALTLSPPNHQFGSMGISLAVTAGDVIECATDGAATNSGLILLSSL